jgi:hypothetical protein
MVADRGPVPARLAPFLAQWDYFQGVLFERLAGLTDEEYLWRPVERMLTVRESTDDRGLTSRVRLPPAIRTCHGPSRGRWDISARARGSVPTTSSASTDSSRGN